MFRWISGDDMAISRGERFLATEMVAAVGVRTFEQFRDKETHGPESFWGIGLSYFGLGLFAGLGPGPASLASALGAVILATIAVKAVPAVKTKVGPSITFHDLPGYPVT
jgi:hypothetical protein